MSWVWWVVIGVTTLYALGRALALSRGAPGPQDIRYHFRHWLPALVARARRSTGNWAVTIGRHTFVRFSFILGRHRAHEWEHAMQAHRMSVPVFLVRWLWQCARYGYRNAPLEIEAAEVAASSDVARFPDLGRPR